MLRSGCVSKRRRAGSPTITLPSASRLTTEGQRVDPDGPGIHFGAPVCGSMYATRLFVVPRSIPTVRGISSAISFRFGFGQSKDWPLHEFLFHVSHQISYVRAAIQQLVQPHQNCLEIV